MGHVRMFRHLRQLAGPDGTVLVGLNTDALLRAYKKRVPVLPWKHKKIIIEAIRWVDKVVPAPNFSPMELLRKHNVDVYALTREWEDRHGEEIAYMKAKGGSVYFSPRYAGVVPTSEIKRRLLEEARAEEAEKQKQTS